MPSAVHEATPIAVLLTGCTGDAEEQWRQLVRQQAPVLRRAALRLIGDHALAEDAAQEALIIAWRFGHQVRSREPAQVQSWLLRITQRAALRLAQRESAEALPDADPMLPDPASAPVLDDLAEAVAALPEAHREPLTGRYLAGHSYAELAAAWNVSEPAARQRVMRAVAELRARMRRGVLPAGLLLLIDPRSFRAPTWSLGPTIALAVSSTVVIGALGIAAAWPAGSLSSSPPAAVVSVPAEDALAAFVAAFRRDHPTAQSLPVADRDWQQFEGRWRAAADAHGVRRLDLAPQPQRRLWFSAILNHQVPVPRDEIPDALTGEMG